jgi:hypothetical protein
MRDRLQRESSGHGLTCNLRFRSMEAVQMSRKRSLFFRGPWVVLPALVEGTDKRSYLTGSQEIACVLYSLQFNADPFVAAVLYLLVTGNRSMLGE